ncbi:hypothetical protein OWR29_22090 [Actinoplanes sp. Pm04-4]|uniref:Uncharacterized protein n=1 Tax=Paractinoplanes pyxinae TaxID=2997416 RepID=A0ABT4B3T0_9ACTN|nr:hypothetical protein [Actinoplanes pyxinae]MCY1140697.1 hypothetical protein [Actinoplanes pyxinae]
MTSKRGGRSRAHLSSSIQITSHASEATVKAWRSAVTAAATLATAFIVAGSQQRGSDGRAMVLTHGGRDSYGNVRFTLSGRPVTGLYPGATQQIKVTVVNPFGFSLSLQTLDASLVGTNRRDCPATGATLRVSAYNGRLPFTIKPYGRSTLAGAIPVTMPRSATPKCANTKLLISLAGTGRKAGR